MRTTTTLMAVGATALALPVAAHAATPLQADVRVPLAGNLTVESQMQADRAHVLQQRLTRRATRLARRVADARHHGFSPQRYRRAVGADSPARLAGRVTALRHDLERAHRKEARVSAASPTLEAIAACESGGNPATNTGNGFYGMYQFTAQTWASVGGTGNPAAASEAEQNRRAAMLYAREGASPWPVCGR
jgi:Transglycosylase-like domain